MEIQLTKEMQREIVQLAKDQAVKNLLSQIMAELNVKQIVAEVKNLAAKEAAAQLSQRLDKDYKVSETVERAVQSAESRVNQRITTLLAKGITVRFAEDSP